MTCVDTARYGLGVGYGILWWFLGPPTILPIWQGNALDWSYARGSPLFGSLVGHIVYGLIVGLIYAAVDRPWVGFSPSPIRSTVNPKARLAVLFAAVGRGGQPGGRLAVQPGHAGYRGAADCGKLGRRLVARPRLLRPHGH